jgi:hypothetical protein
VTNAKYSGELWDHLSVEDKCAVWKEDNKKQAKAAAEKVQDIKITRCRHEDRQAQK